MRSSLGPVLAISVRTEFENVIVKPLIETAVLMFYFRYFSNDTVLMFKKDKIRPKLRFTVDTSDNGNIHFLGIKTFNNSENDIYIKYTKTELYERL